MTYKDKCSKGPVEANGNAVHRRVSPHYATCIAFCEGDSRRDNATLIAEAFNVLHDTGMTPRELADALAQATTPPTP